MSKPESKELGVNRRPSARRVQVESELPHVPHVPHEAYEPHEPHLPIDDATGIAKRVHARRSSSAPPDPRIAAEAAPAHAPGGSAAEGIAFAAPPVEPEAKRSAPPARARARRPRASPANRPNAPTASSARQGGRAAPEPSREEAARDDAQPEVVREAPPEALAFEAHGSQLQEEAGWSGSLRAADEPLPPSLDHADFADDFGLDQHYEMKLRPWLDSLCERHFHVELYGAQNIPAHGRALLVANHSRASVWDGIVLRAALRSKHPAGRVPRWLVDDQQFHAPFLGTIVNRLGAVRACQENAERLLLREELVAVFPEGSKATDRPYEERHRLQRFGRGGYVKLALRTGTPVFPVAIVATEHEGAVWRNRLANASRVLSAPFASLRPGFARIGVLGVPPISARIRIYVGAAVDEISRQDASVMQDEALVHELNECVRSAVQDLVDASLHP